MENSKLKIMTAKRQHFISQLQWVEPANSSLSDYGRTVESGPFLQLCIHSWERMLRLAVIAATKTSLFVRNCQQENENDH